MNIFLCCLQSQLVSHHFWRENFKRSLERMGHTVIEPEGLDFLEPLQRSNEPGWIAQNRSKTAEALVEQVKYHHKLVGIDLFFSYFWALHTDADAITLIEQHGIPTVNYFCDNLREFESVRPLINSYTLNWVPEKRACELYRKHNAPFLYLPMSADPDFYKPARSDELDQVTFIGSADYMRITLMRSVLSADLPLRVYGREWVPYTPDVLANGEPPKTGASVLRRAQLSARQHFQRFKYYGFAGEWRHFKARKQSVNPGKLFENIASQNVSHDQMVALTTNSAVVLGVNRCPHPGYSASEPLIYSRLRDVEAPMMGACYLTEYCEDLEELFDINNEVAVYRNEDELIDECRRLLRDSSARALLRNNGHQAARSRHTWQHRFQKLFAHLGLGSDSRLVA